jgi:hypothetical protein
MAQQQIEIRSDRLLVVEGRDEYLFFEALLKHIGISNIQIIPIGGKANLRNNLLLLKISPGFQNVKAIGLVRDCDSQRASAFQSVADTLKMAKLPIPRQAMIFAEGNPRIAVMPMPPEPVGTDHMLEDLCIAAVADDPAYLCVKQYFECLAGQGIQHSSTTVAKAWLHVFLASKPKPDLRLGEAAQNSHWPWNNPVFNSVKDFMRQLATV